MGVYVHCQLLATAFVHLAALVTGLSALTSLFLSKKEANGNCLLFVTGKLPNPSPGPSHICDFAAFLPAATSTYAFGLLIYYGYAAKVAITREQHVGRSLWVMPFMLTASLVSVFTLISATIVYIGDNATCTELTEAHDEAKITLTCTEALHQWLEVDGKQIRGRIKTGEFSYWAHFLCWVCSLVVLIIRILRNKRARSSSGLTSDMPFPDPSFLTNSDTRGLTEMTPTA